MAKYITRSMSYKSVTFKCYDKSAQGLTDVTVSISDCDNGAEVVTAIKENAVGGNFIPVDVVEVRNKVEKRRMTMENWLKYSEIFEGETDEI